MKRASTLHVTVIAGVAWAITSPLYVAGCMIALVAWPFCCGFMAVWRSLED